MAEGGEGLCDCSVEKGEGGLKGGCLRGDVSAKVADATVGGDKVVADGGVGSIDGRGEVLQRLDVRGVMAFVLGPRAGDEIIEGAHLSCHIGHLGVYNADCLFVDGLCGCLDGGVVLVDCLRTVYQYMQNPNQREQDTYCPILLHLPLERISRL